MNKSPFSFQPPTKFNPSKFNNKDMLFNKKKISSDVMSMSSSSGSSVSSSASSRSDTTTESFDKKKYDTKYDIEKKYTQEDDDDDDESAEDTSSSDDNESENQDMDAYKQDKYESLKQDKKKYMMNELNEKREILYQMDRLESKGYRLPFKFNMESDVNEMRNEYNKLIREKEIDASIRFQRKMMMAFVTGTEYLNNRYDPFAIRLEGWSEQVHENIVDYDDIFEELHMKYKSTGKKMSPELRLFISLSGSAFMFHLTNRMFKENPLPNVEQVLKSNPELMKQFQAAAAKQYVLGDQPPKGGDTSGLFGMVSNLFNNIGGGSMRPSMQSRMQHEDEMSDTSLGKHTRRSTSDIDSIINNVHSKISFEPEHNNIETLSISDEEITSIIEDTADIKILRNSKKNNANNRTLNL